MWSWEARNSGTGTRAVTVDETALPLDKLRNSTIQNQQGGHCAR